MSISTFATLFGSCYSYFASLWTVPAVVQNEIHPYYQENDVIPIISGKIRKFTISV